MTRDEALKFLPIIKAFGEGKTIQFRASDMGNDIWLDWESDTMEFTAGLSQYRIKSESKKKVPITYEDFKDKSIIWVRESSFPNIHYQILSIYFCFIGDILGGDCYKSYEWSTDRIIWNKATKETIEEV